MRSLTFIFLFFLFVSCNKETCKGIEYVNGVTFKNGKLYSGKCITHNPNGTIRSIQSYKDGLDHGEWIFYHDNDELSTIGRFNLGKKVGEWKYYHKNGNIYFHQFFDDNGNEIGTWKEFNENGEIIKTYKKILITIE